MTAVLFVEKAVLIALTLGAAAAFANLCRKPLGWPGRFLARSMNLSHSSLTDWGLEGVPIAKDSVVLDVGCGGGRTIDKLAAVATEGKVHGIDYAAASVAEAKRTNARWIDSGRVEIRQGSVSHLPFPDRTFDLVTAVETHYYWPNPPEDVREILRVLKPGGRFVVIAETYRGRSLDAVYRPAMKLLRATYLTIDGHRELLSSAGFQDVEVKVDEGRGWIRAMGVKPSASRPA